MTLKEKVYIYSGREGLRLLKEFIRSELDEVGDEMDPKLQKALITILGELE